MITANELRLGNWIKVFGGYAQVQQLPNDLPLEPIPLTPEILEKCGFVKCHELSNYYSNDNFHGDGMKLFNDGFYPIDYELNKMTKYPVLYLHQLQNLYFSLTSEELQVNL